MNGYQKAEVYVSLKCSISYIRKLGADIRNLFVEGDVISRVRQPEQSSGSYLGIVTYDHQCLGDIINASIKECI